MTLIFRIALFFKGEICLELEAIIIRCNKISIVFLFDFIRVFFCRSVMLISGRVLLFNSSYIEKEKFSNRFTLIVLAFILRIILLIFSPRVISLLLGWDGLGVTSYLLVCFYSREKRFNARILTALTNRLGDVLILIFISLNSTPGFFNFFHIRFSNYEGYFFIVFIIVAAITKRAQIPFSAWLPAAIAAPTPVSALVHSSTLVTAGVYVLVRFNFIINSWINWVIWAGIITTLIAGLAALIELDIKKIIALSTLRQLGIIIFTLGIGEPVLCWLHLISHAYFKAILFIGAGSMIHRIKDYQDLRKIGSWAKRNQFISSIFIRGSIRLCGIPFLRGFFSKDRILEQILIRDICLIVVLIIFFSTFFTAVYSLRIVLLLFKRNSLRESFSREAISLGRIRFGIIPLTVYSIVGGWILFRFINPDNLVVLPSWLKLRILTGIFFSTLMYFFLPSFIFPKNIFYSGLHQIWFLPLVISPVINNRGLKFSKLLFKEQEISWLRWLLIKVFFVEKNKFYLSSFLNSKIIICLVILILINLIILV